MDNYRPDRPRQQAILPATGSNLERLLRDLQRDIEVYGDERTKQRRRVLLKGFRVGLWTMADKPRLGDVAQVLRAELFGHQLPAGRTVEDDELCQPGTTTEVESDDR